MLPDEFGAPPDTPPPMPPLAGERLRESGDGVPLILEYMYGLLGRAI